MALFIGKQRAVVGVVMLAGGIDNDATGLAPWGTDVSATPTDRLYGFFHDADGMGKAKDVASQASVLQLRGSSYIDSDCCSGAMLHSKDISFTCTSQMDCDAHYAPLDNTFSSSWTYMLPRQFNAVPSYW
jgi:hypothetical protein